MKITKSIIATVGADQAKEYTKFEEPMTYGELLNAFLRNGIPHGAVETYLWGKQEIVGNEGLSDYVTAGDYANMLNDIFLNGAESVDASEFELTFDEWFCVELRELLIDYGIDLDVPVDVDKMESIAEKEGA
ncbi:hypothetical protein [Limosilactobacillus fermentum]